MTVANQVRDTQIPITVRKSVFLDNFTTIVLIISVIYIFTFNNDTTGIGKTATNVLMIAFMGCELLCVAVRKCVVVHPVNLLFALFLFICMMSLLWTADVDLTITRTTSLAIMTLFMLCIFNYIFLDVRKVDFRINVLIRTIVVASAFASVYLLLNSNWSAGGRTNDVIGDANQASAYLSYALPLSMYAISKKLLPKLVCVLQMVVVFASVIVSASRTGLMVCIAGVALYVFIRSYQRGLLSPRSIALIVGVAVGCVALFQYVMTNPQAYEVIGRRLQSIVDIMNGRDSQMNEGSYFERKRLLELAISLWQNHPMFGVGADAYAHFAAAGIRNTFSHNDYMQILSGVGIVGFILYYAQHVYILKNGVRLRGPLQVVVLVMLAQLLFFHFFVVFYYQKLEIIYIVLLVALSTNMKQKNNWYLNFS